MTGFLGEHNANVLILLILLHGLFLTQEVDVGSLCDNIEVDRESGDLWLGCHPSGLKFMLSDPNDPPALRCVVLFCACMQQVDIY